MRTKLKWSKRRRDAAVAAIAAMLSGEEGEGDWPADVFADDLDAAQELLNNGALPHIPDAVQRGLELAMRLARADLECSEPNDFSNKDRADFQTAWTWVHS